MEWGIKQQTNSDIYWAEDRSKEKNEGRNQKIIRNITNNKEVLNRRMKHNDNWMKSSQCYYLCSPNIYMFGIIFYYLNWFTSVDGKTERCALLLPNHRRRINDGYQHDVLAVGVWQNIHHWECTWPSSSVRTSAMVYPEGSIELRTWL